MDTDDRDKAKEKALTKLLVQALRQSAPAAGADCPGADILAAYFDRSLSNSETSRCDAHFALCARCQQILAALAMSEVEAIPVTEIQTVGAEAAAQVPPREQQTEIAVREEQSEIARRRYLNWRWLVPAAAIAAAVALWIALGPAPYRRTSPPTQEGKNATASSRLPAPSAPPIPRRGPEELAQNMAPPPPKTALESHVKTAPAESRSKQKSSTTFGVLGPPGRATPSNTGVRDTAPVPGPPGIAAAPVQRSPSDGTAKIPATAEKSGEPAVTTHAAEKTEESKLAQAPARLSAPNAPVAAPVEAQAKESLKRGGDIRAGVVGGALGTQPADALHRGLAAQPAQVLIAAPGRSVLWRVGAAGGIERSTDSGRTWQVQMSKVETDLVAGSAPSETVCWAVGRAGTILRTTDGEHWEKIASPAPMDLVGVKATDARNAYVWTASHRTYLTQDGGQTWHGPILP